MAKNKALDLTIRINGKIDKSLATAINQANSRVSKLSAGFSKIGTVGLAATAALTTGAVAAISSCIDEAVEYQNALGDVIKYVDGLADAQGRIGKEAKGLAYNGKSYAENYGAVYDAIMNVSTIVPMARDDIADLTALMGQSGKTIEQMFTFDEKGNVTGGLIKDAAVMAAAWDIGAKEAADYGAKWENSFKMSHEEVMTLTNQINYLGANSATTAAEIANAVNHAASLGQLTGIDPATTAALADAMLATGVASDRVGTSIKRMALNLSKGADMTKKQKNVLAEMGLSAEWVAKSLQSDSIGTLDTLFEGINNLPKERQLNAVGQLFGIWAAEGGAKIVNNMDVYRKALAMVADETAYMNSMQREFNVKAQTPEAIRMMRDSAIEMFKVNVGKEFLPVRAQLDNAVRELFLKLNDNLPQLQQLSGTLAELASKGILKVGDMLEKALPYIQQALDYVNNNGPQVVSTIGKIIAVLTGMKFAPQIEGFLGGVGSLLGLGGTTSGKRGGLLGGIASLWKGGKSFAANAATVIDYGNDAASMTSGGLLSRLLMRGTGMFAAANNLGGLNSSNTRLRGAALSKMSKAVQGTQGFLSRGLFGSIGDALTNSGLGKSIANLFQTNIGSSIKNGAQMFGGLAAGGIQGIGQMIASSAPAQFIKGKAGAAAGWLGNKAMAVKNSGFGQAVGKGIGALGKAGSWALGAGKSLFEFGGAGIGVLAKMNPLLSGFGSLFAGAAPVIGVISGIIAVMSILGDHMEDIRGIIGNVFGEKGLKVFDMFAGKISGIKDFIMGLFEPGAIANLLAPLKETITDMFGEKAGAAFGGLITILQSVMGVIGQIVNFATTTVKPIIEQIFSYITQTVVPIILDTFTAAAPFIANIISGLGSAVMSGMQIIGSAIKFVMPIIGEIITIFLHIGQVVIPAVLAAFDIFSQGVKGVIEAVKGIFDGFIQFITGVFTGDWGAAWEGVKQIFGSAFDALVELFKTPVNAVISLINTAISGINGLGITIPDWVPIIGGKDFRINIPTIPMLARGGFTDGPSIAGEIGREAVISFLPGVRAANIATWQQAGRMLGVNQMQAASAVGLKEIDPDAISAGWGGGNFTFAPQITIQGNADRGTIDEALEEAERRFKEWFEQMQRRNVRTAY